MQHEYRRYINEVEDFPEQGITFYDIAPLIGNGAVFSALISDMSAAISTDVTKIAAFDARGFVFGGAIARERGIGLVMLRKPKKLPGSVSGVRYDLEYGSAELEIQSGVLDGSDVVQLVDDVIATGGTALAGIELVCRQGSRVAGFTTVIDLPILGGSQRIVEADVPVDSVMRCGAIADATV